MISLPVPSDPETWEPGGKQARSYSRLTQEVKDRANRIAVNRNQAAFNAAYASTIWLRQNGLVGRLTQIQRHELFGEREFQVGDVQLARNPFNKANVQRLEDAVSCLEGTARAREQNKAVIGRSRIVAESYYLEQTRLYAAHDDKHSEYIKRILGIVSDKLDMVEVYDPEDETNFLVSKDERYVPSEIWYGGIGLGDGPSLRDFALHQFETEGEFVTAVQNYFDLLTELPA